MWFCPRWEFHPKRGGSFFVYNREVVIGKSERRQKEVFFTVLPFGDFEAHGGISFWGLGLRVHFSNHEPGYSDSAHSSDLEVRGALEFDELSSVQPHRQIQLNYSGYKMRSQLIFIVQTKTSTGSFDKYERAYRDAHRWCPSNANILISDFYHWLRNQPNHSSVGGQRKPL